MSTTSAISTITFTNTDAEMETIRSRSTRTVTASTKGSKRARFLCGCSGTEADCCGPRLTYEDGTVRSRPTTRHSRFKQSKRSTYAPTSSEAVKSVVPQTSSTEAMVMESPKVFMEESETSSTESPPTPRQICSFEHVQRPIVPVSPLSEGPLSEGRHPRVMRTESVVCPQGSEVGTVTVHSRASTKRSRVWCCSGC